MMADHEPMTDVACGDPELSGELREALALLCEHSDNDDFRALVEDLLAGRCSLVEASGTAAFGDVVLTSIAQDFQELSDDEKQRLAARAEFSEAPTESCGTPCSGCTALCAHRG
jgi:hypothetical protein